MADGLKNKNLAALHQRGLVSHETMRNILGLPAEAPDEPLLGDTGSTTWPSSRDMRSVSEEATLRDKVRLLEEMVSALVEENKRLTRELSEVQAQRIIGMDPRMARALKLIDEKK